MMWPSNMQRRYSNSLLITANLLSLSWPLAGLALVASECRLRRLRVSLAQADVVRLRQARPHHVALFGDANERFNGNADRVGVHAGTAHERALAAPRPVATDDNVTDSHWPPSFVGLDAAIAASISASNSAPLIWYLPSRS